MATDNIPQLSELEKKVILILAEEGPMSGYDFHLGGKRQRGNRKALMSSSYWLKVKEHLGPRGENLITRFNPKPGRPPKDRLGRKKDLFWLTERGSGLALLNNADAKKVRQNALEVYKNDEEKEAIKIYFELREMGGQKVAKLLDKWVFLVGKVEPSELLLRLLPDLLSLDKTERQRFFKIARDYPKYWKSTEEKIEKMIDALKQVLSHE